MMPRGSTRCQVTRVVAGTRNPEKVAILRGLLQPEVVVIDPPDMGEPDAEEDGVTLSEIATGKALAWSRWLEDRGVRASVIATDGGLLVPGLGSAWDPTRTRRFAGAGAKPLDIARSLLALAANLDGDQREIGWIEAAALVDADGILSAFTAESPLGILATSCRTTDFNNSADFWVPTIWLCPEYGLARLIDLTSEQRAARPDHWRNLGGQLRRNLIGGDRN